MGSRYALIGDPIDRSPSPMMHNAAFASLKLDATYTLRPTTAAEVDRALEELKTGLWQGLNVTTPLKTEVARRIEPQGEAQRAGAVNTVWCEGGRVLGVLTDIEGVEHPLRQHPLAPGSVAWVLGSGGAARAACLALERLGLEVHVACRRPEQGEAMLDSLALGRPGAVWALDAWGSRLRQQASAVIVQATPRGRHGEAWDIPWSELLHPTVAFEMLYWPVTTPFLEGALAAGHPTVHGWEMLVAQGAETFTCWTGRPAPLAAMTAATRGQLGI